jgi:hypothetical protein
MNLLSAVGQDCRAQQCPGKSLINLLWNTLVRGCSPKQIGSNHKFLKMYNYNGQTTLRFSALIAIAIAINVCFCTQLGTISRSDTATKAFLFVFFLLNAETYCSETHLEARTTYFVTISPDWMIDGQITTVNPNSKPPNCNNGPTRASIKLCLHHHLSPKGALAI